jgi:hypothetical protein
VSASGVPTPSVLWLVLANVRTGFQPVSNNRSTNPDTLTFIAQATDNGNEYEAIVSNAAGSATTLPATLTVSSTVPSGVLHTSATKPVRSGQKVTFTAQANGSPMPAVQWQVSFDGGQRFSNIRGATKSTFKLKALARDDGFQYRAALTNRYGVSYTNAATLRVSSRPHSHPHARFVRLSQREDGF